SQAEDENEHDRYEVKTIGEVAHEVGNAQPVAVGGVGLVVGLEGTGGSTPPGPQRSMLEEELRKRNVRDVKEVLNSPNASLVLVSGLLPAGASKGDTFDVEVSLPPQSKTTSLRGGRLTECILYNYDFTSNLDPNYSGPDRALKGHPVAVAEGTL